VITAGLPFSTVDDRNSWNVLIFAAKDRDKGGNVCVLPEEEDIGVRFVPNVVLGRVREKVSNLAVKAAKLIDLFSLLARFMAYVHECRWLTKAKTDSAPVVESIAQTGWNAVVRAPLELDQSTLLHCISVDLEPKVGG
jgi:hypothetical protein